jgi:hypothetical protein
MKIREGFVSNSSSSSFILKKNDVFKDAYELAEKMIPKRGWEEDGQILQKLKLYKRRVKLKSLDEDVEEELNIVPSLYFNSCNYKTYIYDDGEYLYVNTCNNHDWDDFYEHSVHVEKEWIDSDSYEYLEFPGGIEFFSLENGLIGEKT